MKELTLNEMEYISGGFNLFGAASGFASFVANSGVGFTSFVLTSGTAFASFVGDSAMAVSYTHLDVYKRQLYYSVVVILHSLTQKDRLDWSNAL